MRDDRTMDVYDVVVAELFGEAIDPREVRDVVIKMNDASEVHTTKPLEGAAKDQHRKKMVVNTVGQGLNALAMGAGTHALVMAGRDERLSKPGRAAAQKGKITPARIASAPYRAWDNLGRSSDKQLGRAGKILKPVYNKVGSRSATAAKYAVPLAVGALGLHTAELVGDSIAARALADQRKEVKKVLDGIVDARRRGRIDTRTAIEMASELVSKLEGSHKEILNSVDQLVAPLPSKKVQMARQGVQAGMQVADQGAKVAATGRKGLALARKAKPTPITPTEAEPLAKRKAMARYIGNIAEEASRKSSAAAAAETAAAAKDTIIAAEKTGKKLVLIGAGGLASATTLPVVASQGLRRYREKQNGKPLAKSADGPNITWSGDIAKMDSAKRQVFGFAMVTHIDGEPVVDLQGDYTPLEEIEKAAYTYVIESRKGGDMHARDGDQPLHTSDLVESFVITPEKLTQMGLEENALPHGWWVGFKVNDDKQWDDVVNKRRTGFSIHGSGKRVEKSL